MRIKKLVLKNGYKRFHELTIDLGDTPKRIIALVGPNGCGKSSVIDGILFHNNAYYEIGNKGRKDYSYHPPLVRICNACGLNSRLQRHLQSKSVIVAN